MKRDNEQECNKDKIYTGGKCAKDFDKCNLPFNGFFFTYYNQASWTGCIVSQQKWS